MIFHYKDFKMSQEKKLRYSLQTHHGIKQKCVEDVSHTKTVRNIKQVSKCVKTRVQK